MLTSHIIIQTVVEVLAQGQRFLVIGHQKPDGDALGAMAAIGLYLEQNNKEVYYLTPGGVTESKTEQYIPLVKKFIGQAEDLKEIKFDQVIMVDCADMDYAGVKEYIEDNKKSYNFILINIDHHATNPEYGDINLVIPTASSTCEVIFNLFKQNQIQINQDIATSLLTGINFDTNSFSNPSTSLKSLQIASYLLHLGAKQQNISSSFLKNKELGLLKVWGRALARLVINSKYNLAYTVILPEDFEEFELTDTSTDGLANFLSELSGVSAIMVLKQTKDGQIKGSLRATKGNVNVAKLAGLVGGGGHVMASGFMLTGKLSYTNNTWQISK